MTARSGALIEKGMIACDRVTKDRPRIGTTWGRGTSKVIDRVAGKALFRYTPALHAKVTAVLGCTGSVYRIGLRKIPLGGFVVDFYFRRAGMPLAAGALALLVGFAAVPPAIAQQPAAGQAAAGQAPAKNYKDRGEYDLFNKVTQTTDPKARLEVLNTWQDKYPQSDYSQERLQYFVVTLSQLAPNDPTQRQALLNKCQELLKIDPKNSLALYL